MSETILVPIDDSESATEALEFALKNDPDARFVVIHVREPVYGESLVGQDEEEADADALFEEARSIAEEYGVELETVTSKGKGTPSEEIVEYAENNPVEKIVMGSHGREGASRVLLGSVAENVTRQSPVPVTVVR